ncbi:MAG TPA: ABC transporter permease [Vicinamibacterales bacterium]|jgi:ABC-type nitrate/sulfonate/bicarbonate transport system permease component|nr:ABC transporter permease [Vicinamibacterales bacterium]
MTRVVWSVWLPLAALAAWQAAAMAGLASPLFAPAPTLLARSAAEMVRSGELPASIAATLARTAGGFAIGSAIGLAAGLLMGSLRAAFRSFDPILSALNATPKLILLPLLLIVLGVGEPARLTLIALTALVVVAIHTADAIHHVRPAWVELAVNYGADRRALVRHVYLPACLPQVFTGLRLALGNALVIAVSCELVSPSTGLGSVIWLAWQTFSIDRLYIAILTTAALGAGLHGALRLAERRLLPWKAGD